MEQVNAPAVSPRRQRRSGRLHVGLKMAVRTSSEPALMELPSNEAEPEAELQQQADTR